MYDTGRYRGRSVIPKVKLQAKSRYDTECTMISCIIMTLSLITNLSYLFKSLKYFKRIISYSITYFKMH